MLTLEKVGSRLYFRNAPFAAKDQIKALGAKWDADEKSWWIGSAKKAEADKLVAALGDPAALAEASKPGDSSRVYAKVEYKGRKYYVIADGQGRCRLTVLDGSINFWADKSACNLIKEYKPRERRLGYSGRTETIYATLGSIRDFITESKEAEAEIAAGGVPAGYCVDLEDGMVKRRSECDMPQD